MGQLISLSIDLTKIDKSKINNHANGSKYYSITVSINDKPNQFGQDVSAWTEQTKEERASKADRSFIGNGKVVYNSNAPAVKPDNTAQGYTPPTPSDDMPF